MNKLPNSCYIGKIIPKNKFKNYKDEFTSKIERIRYMYLIDDKTSNYSQTDVQDTIVVISLLLKDDVNIDNIIKEIEKSINYNIIYQIEYNSLTKYGFYDSKLFTTIYANELFFDLLANSVKELYESIKKQILYSSKIKLTSKEIVRNKLKSQLLEKEIARLEKHRKNEKQMNKKNDIRKKIRIQKTQLEKINEYIGK